MDRVQAAALRDLLAATGAQVTNALYRAEAGGIAANTAALDLRALVAAGLLEARGSGRSAHYVATSKLRASDTA